MGRKTWEFWIKYELENGISEWEGPYRSELMAGCVAIDLLEHVSGATKVTTYLRVVDAEGDSMETVRLLTRRRRT